MKIRNGFVSNSSSSSFVVAFSSIPNSIEEVRKMLFGDAKSISIYGYSISTEDAAKTVFNDMQEGCVTEEKKIAEEVGSGWFPGHPDHDYNWEDEEAREKYYEDCDKKAVEVTEEFLKANKGTNIFIFEYSDNDGQFFCVMEHAEIFFRLPYLYISKH